MTKVSYYTAEGLKKLRDELEYLKAVESLTLLKLLQMLEIRETYLRMLNMTLQKKRKVC